MGMFFPVYKVKLFNKKTRLFINSLDLCDYHIQTNKQHFNRIIYKKFNEVNRPCMMCEHQINISKNAS